jgi:hypothetical protein
MAFFEVVEQFLKSGLAAAVLIAAAQFLKVWFAHTESKWFGIGSLAGLFLLIVFPYGWDLVFGANDMGWESVIRAHERGATTSALFQADFWGSVIGAGVAYLGMSYLMADRRF